MKRSKILGYFPYLPPALSVHILSRPPFHKNSSLNSHTTRFKRKKKKKKPLVYLDLFTFGTPTTTLRVFPVSSAMSAANGIVVRRAGNFARQLLEGFALRLRDEQSGENSEKHEERENLHHVIKPGRGRGAGSARGRAPLTERTKDGLSENGANFARGGGQAVRGGTVARGEAFAGYDKRGCVGT